MTEKVFIRTMIFKSIGFWLALAFCSNAYGQGIPVEQLDAPAAGQTEFVDSDIGLGFLSSDPLELSSVDGLDDPLERLRLRDSDTGAILDMIQLITQRYILRPQNLPNVKINFCLLYTSPSPRDGLLSRMPSSA